MKTFFFQIQADHQKKKTKIQNQQRGLKGPEIFLHIFLRSTLLTPVSMALSGVITFWTLLDQCAMYENKSMNVEIEPNCTKRKKKCCHIIYCGRYPQDNIKLHFCCTISKQIYTKKNSFIQTIPCAHLAGDGSFKRNVQKVLPILA